MQYNNSPLTAKQSHFAEKHHDLGLSYLKFRRLPVSEFYDIVVFGYLRAVKKCFEREDLQEYLYNGKFKTIAYAAMRVDLGNHFRAQRCEKKNAAACSFDEEIHTPELSDPVWDELEIRLYRAAIAAKPHGQKANDFKIRQGGSLGCTNKNTNDFLRKAA